MVGESVTGRVGVSGGGRGLNRCAARYGWSEFARVSEGLTSWMRK